MRGVKNRSTRKTIVSEQTRELTTMVNSRKRKLATAHRNHLKGRQFACIKCGSVNPRGTLAKGELVLRVTLSLLEMPKVAPAGWLKYVLNFHTKKNMLWNAFERRVDTGQFSLPLFFVCQVMNTPRNAEMNHRARTTAHRKLRELTNESLHMKPALDESGYAHANALKYETTY